MSSIKTAMMIGDISGDSGMQAIAFDLSRLRKEHNPSIVIANAENAHAGYGISRKDCERLFRFGVDVITSGNHAFECAEDVAMFDQYDRLLRPDNFYSGNPGHGTCVVDIADNIKVGVINMHLHGSTPACDNVFTSASRAISRIRKETPIIFVDLHGEEACRKEAFAFDMAGRVTAVCGTHTHVQTMDERIIPGGTAYISDLGMTGVQDSVIGGDVQLSIRRMVSSVPVKVPSLQGKGEVRGCVIEFDTGTGQALSIRRF